MRRRLDRVVTARNPELSRSRVAALIRGGHVKLEGMICRRPATKVMSDAMIEVDIPPLVPDVAEPQALPLEVVYEDEDIVVVDKAAGMVVHPGAGHADGTLVNALLFHVQGLSGIGGVERPGIVHRLDKDTSGLLVVAKHDSAHLALARQFADHSAGRRYLALCHGVPPQASGVIRSRLARHPVDRVRFASTQDPARGKEAVTHWRLLQQAEGLALIGCRLETGRTHQVRVHLCEQGWPLVADSLYRRRGGMLPVALRGVALRCMLHAWRLDLAHPCSGVPMQFEAPLPADFERALKVMGMELGPAWS